MRRESTIGHRLFAAWMMAGLMLTQATAQERIHVAPESRIWIEGRSNVKGFSCTTEAVEGFGVVPTTNTKDNRLSAVVTVAVDQFDCGRQGMTKDLQKALKASEYPEIRYELDSVVVSATEPGETTYAVSAHGRLSLAGQERQTRVDALAELTSGAGYRVTGNLPLLMTDFGVKPPRKALGLIRVRDRIVVHFDIVTMKALSFSTNPAAKQSDSDLAESPIHQTRDRGETP
ncbi:MAG: hypothetical protein ACC655_07385 [Rhodothermia bacterium]